MISNKIPAVVIGGGINGLGIIRNLGKNKIDVYCLSEEKNIAFYSNYCKKYFIYPNVEHNIQKLNDTLNEIKNKIGENIILFPTSDISTLNVSLLNEKLKKPNQHIADSNTIKMLTDKKEFYISLQKNNISSPLTFHLTESKDTTNILEKNDFPIIIKPSQSQNFNEKFSKKGFIAQSQKDLIKYLTISKKHNIEVFIQELIPGPPTNHYFIDGYLDKNSKPLILFARQRLQMYPYPLGNSTICKSIPIQEIPQIKEIIIKYLTNIRYRGIFNAEFKKDSRDNTFKLLEINPRSWWYNSFPTSCKANIILTAYLDILGEKTEIIEKYQTDKKMIYLTEEIKSILANRFNKGFYLNKWSSILNEDIDWILYDKQDIKPFIIKIQKMISYTINHPKKCINILRK